MKLMVLDKDDNWGLHKAKVYEESLELVEAIKEGDNAHIAEEAFDLIQVAIGVLAKLHQDGTSIPNEVDRHNRKLIGRGWKAKAVIRLQVNRR